MGVTTVAVAGAPVPTSLVAATVNEYDVPGRRPSQEYPVVVAATSCWSPPGVRVITKPVLGPSVLEGADHWSVAERPYGQAGQVTPNAAVMSGKEVFLIAVCGAVCGATLTLLALALLFQLWLLALAMLLSLAAAAVALTRWRDWTAGVRKSDQAGLP